MAGKTPSEPAVAKDQSLDALGVLQEAGFKNMFGMGTAWLEAIADLNAELVRFVAERIKEDAKTQHEILLCKDVGELQHIQAKFMQKAIAQYHAETGKLVEMGSRAFAPKDAGNKS